MWIRYPAERNLTEFSGLYSVNPSPTPVASQAPPSPPPSTCTSGSGCYSVNSATVQFTTGDDGGYTPSQTLYPGTGSQVQSKYYLNVQYLTLEERDANGDLVVSVPFPTSGYTLASQTQLINNVSVNVMTFSVYLLNGAEVDVTNYFFEQDGNLDFAGTTVSVAGKCF